MFTDTLHNDDLPAIITDMSDNCPKCYGSGIQDEGWAPCDCGATTREIVRGAGRPKVVANEAPARGNGGKGAAKPVKIATVKQVAYLRSLIEARDLTNEIVAAANAVCDYNMSMRLASTWIDTLRAMPATVTSTGAVRTNKYSGKCKYCGGFVAEGAGRIAPKTCGKGWDTMHLDGQCPEKAAQAPESDHKRGDVHVIDGEYYRVHIGQKSGMPYAVKAVLISEAEWDGATLVHAGEVEWEIARGFINKMNPGNKATAEESHAFGHMVGRCCYCSHEIDTPESVTAGYGPTCAVKYGLPWG